MNNMTVGMMSQGSIEQTSIAMATLSNSKDTASKKVAGSRSSMMPMSREHRFNRTPIGLLSVKFKSKIKISKVYCKVVQSSFISSISVDLRHIGPGFIFLPKKLIGARTRHLNRRSCSLTDDCIHMTKNPIVLPMHRTNRTMVRTE